MTNEVDAVIAAWTDAGPMPAYHEAYVNDLRMKWPTLADALDALAAAEEPEQVRAYRIGDRVAVASSTSRFDGMTGTVVEYDSQHGFDYIVKSDASGKMWGFHDDELQPLPRHAFYACAQCGTWINTQKYISSPRREPNRCPTCDDVMVGCDDTVAVARVLNSRQV